MPIDLLLTANNLTAGAVAELFHGPPYTDRELSGRKELTVRATVPVGPDGRVTFATHNLPAAIRIRSGDTILARSNGITALPAPVAGDVRITILQVFSTFPRANVGDLVPPLPIVEDKLRVTALTIDLVADALRLRGTIVRDGVVDIDFTFTALVNIHPTTRPVFDPTIGEDTPDFLCEVEIVDLELQGVRRLEGALVNLFRGTVRRRMERAIQRRIHERVMAEAAQLGPHVTMTAAETSAAQLQLTLSGWIPLVL